MKKILFALAAIIATLATVNTTSAQSLGDWNVGGRINIYSRWNGTVGIGAYGRYGFDNGLRVEPAVMFLCEKGMSVDISADLQYATEVASGLELYPLAGISLNDPGKFGLGINLGGGAEYYLSERLSTGLGLKWIIQTQKYVSNPLVISLSCGYKF